jgi:DNA-binding GntR family transcriptional regulator
VDGLESIIFRNAPGGALVALIVFAVIAVWRGWLVPKTTVDRLDQAVARVEAVQEKRLAESVARETEWRSAWVAAEHARRLQAEQIGDLLELAKTTDAFIRGLRDRTGSDGR